MPPPHTSIRPLGGQIHVLVQNNLVRSFRALQHDLTLYFFRDTGGFQCLQIPRKARVIHCHALCFARLRACAPVFFFFLPQITFSKPETEPLAGKRCHSDPSSELHLCLSHSPPLLVSSPSACRSVLISCVIRHVKGRRKTVISVLNFSFSCQDLSFNYHPPAPLPLSLVFSCLSDPSAALKKMLD